MSLLNLTHFAGQNAVGVIDFGAAAEAGATVTIGGTVYTEADAEDLENGIFTNGASAADSATSFADAVNGDIRKDSPNITAFVSDAGDSVVLIADNPGTAGNLAASTDSASNVTVEDMHDGKEPGRKKIAAGDYVVTDQDILADEINIGLPFQASTAIVNLRTSAGETDAATFLATTETSPNRLQLNFGGATDPEAGDIVHYVAFE